MLFLLNKLRDTLSFVDMKGIQILLVGSVLYFIPACLEHT